jgi:hypothetical protein
MKEAAAPACGAGAVYEKHYNSKFRREKVYII